MAGSISLSLSQQFDSLGKPLNGGLVYFYQAGTVATPQNAFQDSALTIPHPNPLTLDAAGRVPQLYFDDGSIKYRITDSGGVAQVNADNVLVVGPSGGGGGGGTVDPTTVLGTGDLKVRYGIGTISGFVRANARTLGSATSSATERANADCQALFEYLWTDLNLVVSGGRGGTANADWLASKVLTLPDWRGRAIAGLDDMGATAAGRLTATYFGASGITLGAGGGSESKALVTANLPAYTPTGTVADGSITVGGLTNVPTSTAFTGNNNGGGGGSFGVVNGGPALITASQTGSTFTGAAQGGVSTPVAIASPMALATIYIKL